MDEVYILAQFMIFQYDVSDNLAFLCWILLVLILIGKDRKKSGIK